MRSRIAVRGVLLVLALLVATPLAAEAQPKDSLPRVGHLFVIPSSATAHLREAFRQGLRELGYVEGQNLIIEFRSADGRAERLPELATELVRLRVDVIVAAPDVSIRAAQLATRTIPIVMAVSLDDPVEQRFVASLARPGGNVTGLSTLHEGLGAKRLELLKAVVPKLARVAVLWDVDNSSQAAHLRTMETAARALGIQLQSLPVQGASPDLDGAFRAAARSRVGALIIVPGANTFTHRARIAVLAAGSRMPTMAGFKQFVEDGSLMAYGPSSLDMHRRAAFFVDKILKGAKPGDLPVEQPTKFELAINLKNARARGVTIPQSLLLRADQVIE